jgi:hypothetical protein
MPEPSFWDKWEWARAHQKPEPKLVVDNSRAAQAGMAPMTNFAPPMPAIGETDPDAITLLDSPVPRKRPDALAISAVVPDAITLLDDRSRPSAGTKTQKPRRPGYGPDGWPADGRFIKPEGPVAPPHIFQGPIGAIKGYPEDGRHAWRANNDPAIVAAVNRHNIERKLYPGDAEFMTPKLLKSLMMEESGDAGDRAAFERDPFQVNVRGDWAPEKSSIAGLQQGQAMTPQISAYAALKWLAFKGRKVEIGPGGKTYLGPFRSQYEAIRDYNGRTDPYRRKDGKYSEEDRVYVGKKFKTRYVNRIMDRVRE